jgi:hypothetical protein
MNRVRSVGFTVLEMLVALLLVGLVLTLSVQLLMRVQATSLDWRRTLPDPVPQFAIQLLRNDLHRSHSVSGSPGDGPLVLTLSDGSSVSYESSLGQLVRVVIGEDGAPLGQRTVMRGIDLWNWHMLARGLIEIQVVYRRHRDPGGTGFGGIGALNDPGSSTETLTLRFAQRAGPGTRVW